MIYEIYSEKKQTEASGFPSGNQSVRFPFTYPGLTDTLRVPVWASFAGQLAALLAVPALREHLGLAGPPGGKASRVDQHGDANVERCYVASIR